MTLSIPSQRNLYVRDNSGAKTRKLIQPRSRNRGTPFQTTLSRVISSTKQQKQVRKDIEHGKVVKVLLVNTRANMKGLNGIVRCNQKTTVVVVNEKGNLSGTRLRTKLPKSLYGKGRSLRPISERD